MAELSVTDVQKALRMHADLGHDVYSSPHTVLLGEVDDPMSGNKPFGMAVTHTLVVPSRKSRIAPGYNDDSILTSYLSHGEKTSITRVNSFVEPETQRLIYRSASLDNPATVVGDWADSGRVRHTYGPAFGMGHLTHKWHFGNVIGGNPSRNTSGPLHETLKKHLSAPITYLTHHVDTGTKDIAPRSAHGWNPREANESVANPLHPFSNKIHVMHHSGNYAYDPSTEKLTHLA